MKPNSKAAVILIASVSLCLAALAADPAAPQGAPSPTPEPALHEISAPPAAAAVLPQPAAEADAEPTAVPGAAHHQQHGDDRVSFLGSTRVDADEKIDGSAVAFLGAVTVDGTVNGDAVSFLGSNTVNGVADGDAVAVLGANHIDGTVHGTAVAILGDLILGPKARVDGDTVSIGGRVIRDPSASVGGKEVEKPFKPGNLKLEPWLHRAFTEGRPLSLDVHRGAFWFLANCALVLYLLLALAFPGAIRKCGDTLVLRPGATFLAGLLTLAALPVLFILIFITIVGIPVAVVVLPVTLIGCMLFGKVAVYSLVGRSVLGKQTPPVLATLVGTLLFLALYFLPYFGPLLWLTVDFFGFACVVTTLFTSDRPAAPAVVPPRVPPLVPVPPVQPAILRADAPEPPIAPPIVQTPPPDDSSRVSTVCLLPVGDVTLPRAGFWIRMVALLIDALLVGVVTRAHSWFPAALAIYGAVLWKLRGATIGGIIFGLKVVRLDGRPSDWATVIVRALACFFSLIVVGLGFFWIAFDAEKQAWHDKIAGTVVVKAARRISLV
jgi:hypothetical protein